MKLHLTREQGPYKLRTKEAAGLEVNPQQEFFDPEREIPQEYREEWLRLIDKPFNGYQPAAEELAAYYLQTFPDRKADIDLDKIWKKHKPLSQVDSYYYLLVLFPEKCRDIKQEMEKQFGPNLKDAEMRGPNQDHWARLAVVLKVLFPDQLPRNLPNMEEHWKYESELGPVPPGLTHLSLLADVRLDFPERFKQLKVTPETLEALKEKVMESIETWQRRTKPEIGLHSTQYVAALRLLTADEIKIHPMGGLEVIQRKHQGLRAERPLPDRPTV